VITPDDGLIRTPDVRPTGLFAPFVIGQTYTLRLYGEIHRFRFLGTEEGGSMRWLDDGIWHPARTTDQGAA